MSIDINRIIGLTQEKRIEDETQVENLHIGFQNQLEEQKQKDPSGHYHRAPVVAWRLNGKQYHYVPTLRFKTNVTHTPWIKRVLGLEDEPDYKVDAEHLEQDIRQHLEASRKETA